MLGVLEHRRDPAQPAVEMGDRFREPIACLLDVLGGKDRADQRAQQPVLVLASVPEAVTQEWTVQRCQAQPRTFAIAAFKPACASEMAS